MAMELGRAIMQVGGSGKLKGHADEILHSNTFSFRRYPGGSAQQSAAGVVMGAGMTSCAEFAKEYRQNPESTESIFFSWAQGFMSGTNLAFLALKKPMHDLNAWSIHDQKST
jgi:hypothetical protein